MEFTLFDRNGSSLDMKCHQRAEVNDLKGRLTSRFGLISPRGSRAFYLHQMLTVPTNFFGAARDYTKRQYAKRFTPNRKASFRSMLRVACASFDFPHRQAQEGSCVT
jgi:hypothetical protein